MPALIVGANLPDVDAACFFWLDGVKHLGFRRGITHGPIAWLLLPLLLAGVLYAFDRWQAKRGKRPKGRLPVHFGCLYVLSFLACLTHPALDWLNVYGIRLLEPFSHRWFYGDVLFIIDVWLWALMGFAIWFSLRREKRCGEWRRPARVGIALTLAYVGMNAWTTHDFERVELLDARYDQTIASPVPLAFWERELIFPNLEGRHAIIEDYAGPTEDRIVVRKLGDAFVPSCKLDEAARSDAGVRAFLFWSRVPFVELRDDGSTWLKDARFADPRVGDRFAVHLPKGTCKLFFG